MVEFGAGRRWWKRYTRDWGRSGLRAWDLAMHAIDEMPEWRRLIESWQAPVLADPERPAWYKMALFNELYFLVDGGTFWENGEVGDPVPPADHVGRFALLECLDYPFYDTVDVDFYASFAILELYPELEMAGIRDLLAAIPVDDPEIVTIDASGLSAPRKVGGTVPHDVGGPDDDPFYRPNRYRFQDVSGWKDLGPKFVLQAWRDAVAAGDDGDALIREVWPTVDDVMTRLSAKDRDGDGLPEHDGLPDQTYDTWPMRGPSAYGGSLWLAALAAAEAMALRLGDPEAARRWEGWFERAQVAFDVRLWRDGHYAYDDGHGPSSDSIMADQLAGQWYADATGLGDLLPRDRVEAALRTVHEMNVLGYQGGRMGAVNGMRPDGTVDGSSEQSAEVWVGTTYALAAFMIGRGLIEEGWETAARRRVGHLRARAVVPDAGGVRRRRRLPRHDLPPTARDLGHRGGAAPLAGGALGPRRRPRTGRSGPGPPRDARRTSRSTSGRGRRPTVRTRCPARPRRAPLAGALPRTPRRRGRSR